MKRSIAKRLADRKRQIGRRLDRANRLKYRRAHEGGGPVLHNAELKLELGDRARGIAYGGVPLLVRLADAVGLVDAIDRRLKLLRMHLPYHEGDHVLNFAINALCDGDCMQHMELRRNDACFLDALGADATPDPTTAGDFCRRFEAVDVRSLMDAIDDARINVWRRQPGKFFREATIDMDGTLVITTGECKEGMDISYKGEWGYHPLLVTLANTGELLSLVNRSGNRPSEEGAAAEADRAIALCRRGGFRRVRLRGDTAFSQTEHLDRWDSDGVLFQFGYDATPNLKETAENLGKTAWTKLLRPPAYVAAGPPRQRPPRVKRQVIRRRAFLHLELQSEEVAGFEYRPTACKRSYRMIVVRKNLVSNWAYMVMTSLAWTLKAWAALWLPVHPAHREAHEAERRNLLRMEFKTFINALVKIPCQIVRQSRRLIVRVLSWNPYLPALFRLSAVLRC